MRRKDTQKVALTGILIALIAIMTFIPFIGYINIGFVTLTTIFVPVIIGIIYLKDIRYSLVLGLAFGFLSFLKALVKPETLLDPFFANPLVSIVPRILMAVVGHYVYVAFSRQSNKWLTYSVTALLTTVANTVFVLGSLLLFYFNDINTIAVENEFASSAWSYILLIITTGSIFEFISSVVLTIIVMRATDYFIERYEH